MVDDAAHRISTIFWDLEEAFDLLLPEVVVVVVLLSALLTWSAIRLRRTSIPAILSTVVSIPNCCRMSVAISYRSLLIT